MFGQPTLAAPHIILDVSPIVHRKAGLATYTRMLGEAMVKLAGPARFSTFHYDARPVTALPPLLAALPRTVKPWAALRWRLSVALAQLTQAPKDHWITTGRRDKDVLFHATEHLLPPLRMPAVFTFHDAIYARYPQFHTRKNIAYLRAMMPRFLRQAAHVIAVSECSKQDCMHLYGVPETKISVIAEAADPAWQPVNDPTKLAEVRAKYGIPQNYLLYLGTIEPRKNLPALLDALASLIATQPEEPPTLVIAGKKGWMFAPIFSQVAALGLEQRVIFTGFVPDADAPALLSGARAFAFPSHFEGFGLPVLEAMQCGAPVMCSNSSSLPEVAGDAALLVDPNDTAAIAQALQALWTQSALRADLRARGLAQAVRFSWARAAAETLAVYDRVMEPNT